ncbi:hypothetical protein PFISCL1PPCAC_9117, partial [Pristionchus fissidentatus]
DNTVRGVSKHFGEDVLQATMEALDLSLIVRGHQMMMNGFSFFGVPDMHRKRVLATVFTAPSYYADRVPNRGSAMYIDQRGHIGFKILAPSTGEGGESAFRGDHDLTDQHDDGYIKCVDNDK